jgi:phosphatidate cytidylyltransferase
MTGLRLISAVLLGGLLLAVILLAPPVWTGLLIGLAMLIGAWEWSGFLRAGSLAPRLAYVVATAVLLGLAWRMTGQPEALRALLLLAATWWVVALLWIARAPHSVTLLRVVLAGWLTLVPAGVALWRLRMDWPLGMRWLLFTLFLVWAADTGAYFAGRAFGRHKLAPQVSPGKTWEGVAGGMALAGLLAGLAAPGFGQPTLPFVSLCLVVAGFSVVGDLSESLFKRYAGLKDSGRLIPGHGGMLDRIDSITAAAPLLMLGVVLLDVAGP